MHTPGSSLPRFDFSQLAQLPFEWPMARLSIDFPSIAASFSQNVSRLAVEKTLNGQTLTDSWLETTCEKLAWEATGQAASVIATLFQGTGSVEVLHQFPAWLHLESQEFWQKALYIELAGECHDLAPMSRSSQSRNVKKRCADSISSFVVIQRQKQNANRLPIQNVNVYFPCLLTTQVLRNLPSLSVEGAVTVDQSLRSAISQDVVAVGSAINDTTQQFSTLVLRAGRTSLPSLHVPDLSTPLTRKVFTAGLFDATTTSNLGASFGQTKVRLEVRSASPEQYEGDFNTEKEWHQYMPTPWDVMQLSPAQALTISCQSCGVQIASGDLRDTYGRSFVVKSLYKVKRDCYNLFPQDNKRINLPRLASIFEEPGFVTPDAPQHQFGAHREHCPAHQWLEQLDECGIDPLNLALQVFKPWEAVSHSAHSSQRERSRRTGKGKKGGKQEGKQQRPPGAGPGTGKGRNWYPSDALLKATSYGRCPFYCTDYFPWHASSLHAFPMHFP